MGCIQSSEDKSRRKTIKNSSFSNESLLDDDKHLTTSVRERFHLYSFVQHCLRNRSNPHAWRHRKVCVAKTSDEDPTIDRLDLIPSHSQASFQTSYTKFPISSLFSTRMPYIQSTTGVSGEDFKKKREVQTLEPRVFRSTGRGATLPSKKPESRGRWKHPSFYKEHNPSLEKNVSKKAHLWSVGDLKENNGRVDKVYSGTDKVTYTTQMMNRWEKHLENESKLTGRSLEFKPIVDFEPIVPLDREEKAEEEGSFDSPEIESIEPDMGRFIREWTDHIREQQKQRRSQKDLPIASSTNDGGSPVKSHSTSKLNFPVHNNLDEITIAGIKFNPINLETTLSSKRSEKILTWFEHIESLSANST